MNRHREQSLGGRGIVWAAAVLLLSACASTSGREEAPTPHLEHLAYSLQPLDTLVVGAPAGDVTTLSLDAEGHVSLPGGETLALLGAPVAQGRSQVEKAWKGAHVLRVIQFQSPRVSVVGEVQRPQALPLSDGPMYVMDAIAATGGFTTMANTRRVTVLRKNAEEVEIFNLDLSTVMKGRSLDQNIALEAGDVVTVGRSLF